MLVWIKEVDLLSLVLQYARIYNGHLRLNKGFSSLNYVNVQFLYIDGVKTMNPLLLPPSIMKKLEKRVITKNMR